MVRFAFQFVVFGILFAITPFSHFLFGPEFEDESPQTDTRPVSRVKDAPQAAAAPVISVWYGLDQTFGTLGWPQNRINILGNASDPDGNLDGLSARLNGQAWFDVTLGVSSSGNERLVRAGDFNIELFDPSYEDFMTSVNPYTIPPERILQDGTNTLELRAVDSNGATQSVTVTIHYAAYTTSRRWPMGTTDWGAGSLTSRAQVIDGKWQIQNGSVRILEPGYDRVIAIGNVDWDNYTVEVPLTVYDAPPDLGGVGVILGWQGHYQQNSEVPFKGWVEMGAYGYFSIKMNDVLAIRIEVSDPPTSFRAPFDLQYGRRYMLKMQVESSGPETSIYRIKMWPAGETEPAAWAVERTDPADLRPTGSMLLVAHLVDAAFGDVHIYPNDTTCYQLTRPALANGAVVADPEQACFTADETVTLQAVPEQGYRFSGWQGDLASYGTQNPISLNLSADLTAQASFTLLPTTTATVTQTVTTTTTATTTATSTTTTTATKTATITTTPTPPDHTVYIPSIYKE